MMNSTEQLVMASPLDERKYYRDVGVQIYITKDQFLDRFAPPDRGTNHWYTLVPL